VAKKPQIAPRIATFFLHTLLSGKDSLLCTKGAVVRDRGVEEEMERVRKQGGYKWKVAALLVTAACGIVATGGNVAAKNSTPQSSPVSHIVYWNDALLRQQLAQGKVKMRAPANPLRTWISVPEESVFKLASICSQEAKSWLGDLGVKTCAAAAINRLKTGHFGNTLTTVLKKGGFNVITAHGGLNRMPKPSSEEVAWVYEIIDEVDADPTFGGVLYFRTAQKTTEDPFYAATVVSDANKNHRHDLFTGMGRVGYAVPTNVSIKVVGRTYKKPDVQMTKIGGCPIVSQVAVYDGIDRPLNPFASTYTAMNLTDYVFAS
jgi:hypothetical protein